MAYDLEEQEQLASIKAWWERWGNLVLTAVTVVLLAIAAFNGWRWYERREAFSAARIHEQMLKALDAKEPAKAREVAGSLIEQHGGTIFAAMAALQVAKLYHESGDLNAAKAQLRWVIDKSGRAEFAATARVRLAGVLMDEKAYDEALKLVSGDVPASHAVQFADRRGDVLLAMDRIDPARQAYREALDKAGADHPMRAYIQMKLDALPEPAAS